jgi:ubiquinone/menaquinone biosynthesis C-methylase UbiE
MELLPERRFTPLRRKLWSLVPAGKILEVGVGTGRNFLHHPAAAEVTGIDLSDQMLAQAHRRSRALHRQILLKEMDVQQLDFPDNSFDTAVATFVFCSVPNPVRGMHELARVVRPDGLILLLEHVRIERPAMIGKLMDWLDPFVVRVMGPHINRRTVETTIQAGLYLETVEDHAPWGLIKLIAARPPS